MPVCVPTQERGNEGHPPCQGTAYCGCWSQPDTPFKILTGEDQTENWCNEKKRGIKGSWFMVSGSHAPAWEPICRYAFPRRSVGTRAKEGQIPRLGLDKWNTPNYPLPLVGFLSWIIHKFQEKGRISLINKHLRCMRSQTPVFLSIPSIPCFSGIFRVYE